MSLREWLTQQQITQTDMADLLGVSVATVSRWVNDEQSPRIEQAIAIEQVSGGAVPVEEWQQASAARVAR